MATNNPAPSPKTGAKKFIRLKDAAFEMEVSYMWLYKRVVLDEAIPHVRRGATIMIPLSRFIPWSRQQNIP